MKPPGRQNSSLANLESDWWSHGKNKGFSPAANCFMASGLDEGADFTPLPPWNQQSPIFSRFTGSETWRVLLSVQDFAMIQIYWPGLTLIQIAIKKMCIHAAGSHIWLLGDQWEAGRTPCESPPRTLIDRQGVIYDSQKARIDKTPPQTSASSNFLFEKSHKTAFLYQIFYKI